MISVTALFSGEVADVAFARSSSPAMIRTYSQHAERQQNSRCRAQTLLTFNRLLCSFR